MDLDRRKFLKVIGITSLSLAIGKDIKAEDTKVNKEFNGVLYDASRCKGCHGCEYDCSEANSLPEPAIIDEDAPPRKTDETRRTVVNKFETSKGPVFTKIQCMHCNEPACVAACLTQAMYKTPEGAVIWREDKCMGCRYCMISCPFDSPKFEYHSPNPKIEKCSMCFETRISQGEIPACAENCPNDALLFGNRRELISEARRRIYESPDQYIEHIYGEHEAGGTCWLYISPVPFKELGMNTKLQKESYPALTKGFLYSVPSIFVLVPALLLGIQQATKINILPKENEDE
ncbi:MAG: 4Fe-4S dicluster domain-containing protein [Bacteroidales bacterium]|nr:4Fe-4S dicluster domain-containing protein [Bacteroidales bacterium]